jgi:hypothetical protein
MTEMIGGKVGRKGSGGAVHGATGDTETQWK